MADCRNMLSRLRSSLGHRLWMTLSSCVLIVLDKSSQPKVCNLTDQTVSNQDIGSSQVSVDVVHPLNIGHACSNLEEIKALSSTYLRRETDISFNKDMHSRCFVELIWRTGIFVWGILCLLWFEGFRVIDLVQNVTWFSYNQLCTFHANINPTGWSIYGLDYDILQD